MDYRSTGSDHSPLSAEAPCRSEQSQLIPAPQVMEDSPIPGSTVLAPNPPAPETQRRLLWPEAALLLGCL